MAFLDAQYVDWTTIAIAASAISVIISAMLIMFSRLLGLKNLEQTAKAELVFAISTVLIVMLVESIVLAVEGELAGKLIPCLYLISFGKSCDTTIAAPTAATAIDWMKLYLDAPMECVADFMNTLYMLSIPVEAGVSVYMEIFMSEVASGFGLKWISERIKNATESITFYVYVYYLLGYILDFVKHYAGFFFSAGVALRAFPPTRGAGAYVMALSIGLYFVFPLTYILIASLSLPHAQSAVVTLEGADIGSPGSPASYVCTLPKPIDMTAYACQSPSVAQVFEMKELFEKNYSDLTSFLNYRIFDFLIHLASTMCIFPVVAFVVLLTFVLNTTGLFGGNIPEIGRGIVKLI